MSSVVIDYKKWTENVIYAKKKSTTTITDHVIYSFKEKVLTNITAFRFSY